MSYSCLPPEYMNIRQVDEAGSRSDTLLNVHNRYTITIMLQLEAPMIDEPGYPTANRHKYCIKWHQLHLN